MHDSVQHHVHQNDESEHRFIDIITDLLTLKD